MQKIVIKIEIVFNYWSCMDFNNNLYGCYSELKKMDYIIMDSLLYKYQTNNSYKIIALFFNTTLHQYKCHPNFLVSGHATCPKTLQ